jgi:hypothetical protein
MISKYLDFINENFLFQLLLESKIVFSKKFINIINKMKDNKIANELIKLSGNDYDVRYNYIDTTDLKDTVSFIPDDKAEKLKSKKVETFRVIDNSKYLTHSPKNDRIFEALGYDKTIRENWAPDVETIGIILKEVQSSVSSKVYVLFQEYVTENPRLAVLNKIAVEPEESESQEFWTSSRNKMKIGRLVRAILKSSGVSFIDKDIEKFTNEYKATFDFFNDALKQFDIVKGREISEWYSHENYDSDTGTLSNSCMAHSESETFDIYVYNSQVNLIILYSDDGQIISGKYTSDKIKGRALLWLCDINGLEVKFMDRIYTNNDSDVELFKQFAKKNGFWYKVNQNSNIEGEVTDGNRIISYPNITVRADEVIWDYYPYLDTICYIDTDNGIITNNKEKHSVDRECRNTDGTFDSL